MLQQLASLGTRVQEAHKPLALQDHHDHDIN